MTKPQVLIIGGGSIGERHVRCFLRTDECQVSLCEVNAARREQLAKNYPLTRSFTEFEQAPLAEFEVVVVATPAPFHMPQSIAAARAGCHVLCEKPISNQLDGIQELIDILQEKRKIGATAFTMRSVSALGRMKQHVDQGTIGTPRMAVANISQYFPHMRPAYREIYFAKKAMGGGTLFDMCPHSINLMEWFLGPESQVHCMMDRLALEGIETDDTALLNFRHRNGALSQINCTLISQNYRYDVSVHGTKGSVVYDYVKCEVALYIQPEPTYKPTIETFPAQRDDLYVEQARHFLAATRGEKPVACTLEEGWQTLRAVFAAQRAAESGKSEKVE